MSSEQVETQATVHVLERYLKAFATHDIDDVMAFYTEESVVTSMHTGEAQRHEGTRAIRRLFVELFDVLPVLTQEQLGEFTERIIAQGPMGMVGWRCEDERVRVPYATDTFVLKRGSIVSQSFSATIEQRDPEEVARSAMVQTAKRSEEAQKSVQQLAKMVEE